MRFVFLCLTAVSVISSGSSSSLPVSAPFSCDSAHKDAVRCLAWNAAAVSAGARQLSPPHPLWVSSALRMPSRRKKGRFTLSSSSSFFSLVLFPYLLKMLLIFHPTPPPSPALWRAFSMPLHLIHTFFPFPSSFQTHMTEI